MALTAARGAFHGTPSRLLIKISDLRFSPSSLHRGTTKICQLDESELLWGALIPTQKSGDFFSSLLESAGLQRADRVDFDRRVRLEFRGTQISSDGGLLVMRDLDDALGLSDLAATALRDTRRGKNTVHRLDGLFRQSVFGRLAGYEDVNDAERLARDPVMRQVVGGRAVDAQAASASQMGRFETETLAMPENREALADLNGQWIDRFHYRNGLKYIVLDMDSSVSPTHGDQEGAAWNGHFDCTCYHPNFLFNQFGMLERCALRHGNVHSADGWRDVLDPVIARYAERDLGGRFFRADAAYAIPAIYERLEEARYFYAIRLPANNVLREKIAHRLKRPVGRPSLTKVKRFFEDFEYKPGLFIQFFSGRLRAPESAVESSC